jgi:hypothetical protein
VTLLVFCLILFSGACSVTGQIFFKHAMSGCVGRGKPRRSLNLAAGVLAMTVGFFTWLTLLQRFNANFSRKMPAHLQGCRIPGTQKCRLMIRLTRKHDKNEY